MSARISLPTLALVLACGCVRWGMGSDEDSFGDAEGTSSQTDTQAGEETTDDTGDEPFPWPEQWPVDPDARVVVWGKTGIPTRNLAMMKNIFVELGGVEGGTGDGDGDLTGDGDGDLTGDGDGDLTGDGDGDLTGDGDGDLTGDGDGDDPTGDGDDPTGDGDDPTGDGDDPTGDGDPGGLRILWIDDCDPREDAIGCLAGNVQPFFTMVAELGTIEFKPLSLVDPLAYDVVVADFCGPVSATQVATMLGDGARVLVLGDYWCETPMGVSAERANELLTRIGARFTGDVIYNHNFLVATAKQVGLLEGVPALDAWGVALQDHLPSFEAAVGTIEGAILTSRSE
jgi:hypothetical protein